MLLAGLDIGTTGCKISVFTPDGKFLGNIARDYPARRSRSEHEVDAVSIRENVKTVIREAAEKFPGIGGIGITSFGESFVLVDQNDEPLMPILLYTDPRGEEQCARLVEKLGEMFMIETTGLSPHHMYSLPKIMWIHENLPEVYAAARHIFMMEDYVVYILTGKEQMEYSLATRSMAFDIHSCCWSKEVCEAADIDPNMFSTLVPTATSAGCILPELAEELGLSPETVIVSVAHDQVAAAIGSGVFDSSCTVDGAGTVECMTPVFTSYDAARMAQGKYCIVPFITPGSFVTYAFSYTGGALVKWFVDNLAGYAMQESKEIGTNIYDHLEGEWNGEPTGILVLPHFAGAATPYMDAGSRGAIVGLLLSHTQQDIYRAFMEGVCFEMRLNMENLARSGVEIAPLHATGGGAKSRVWMQMKADILNVPVTALESSEAGAVGCAMTVGVVTGVFASLEEAAKAMVHVRHVYQPRPEVHARYEEVYQRYKNLYNAVRPLI